MTAPDALFADPRLAQLYDTFDGERDDLPPYLELIAALGARSVLDMGCGTGALAVLLAARGLDVVGVDPAAASIDVARTKAGAERVRWIAGDAAELPPLQVDLAVMTGNVAQVSCSDADWVAVLDGLHAALRPGGYLVFESRRPDRRAWLDWAADTTPVTHEVAGIGAVTELRSVTAVELPLVSFGNTYLFPDGSVVSSRSTIRFRGRPEIEDALVRAGFEVTEVRDAPDRPGREWVFVARRGGVRPRPTGGAGSF